MYRVSPRAGETLGYDLKLLRKFRPEINMMKEMSCTCGSLGLVLSGLCDSMIPMILSGSNGIAV